jgi:hypothetical protein
VSVVSGAANASKTNKANKAAYAAGLQEEALQWNQNVGANKAVAEANLQNTIRTGFKVGLLNVQRAQAKKNALQQGINLSRSVLQVTGAATANAAAAGTIGSSVDAVITDINMREGEALAQMDTDYQIQSDNFDTQLHDLLISGMDQLQSADNTSVRKTTKPNDIGFGEVLAGAAIQAAGSYISSKMTLGLGTKAVDSPNRTSEMARLNAQL